MSLPDGYDAQSTAAAVSAALSRQPRHLVKTLTWDQGREMPAGKTSKPPPAPKSISASRARRGSAPREQTNGLLRRWLPKGTNLNIGQVRLALIQDSINAAPQTQRLASTRVYTERGRNDRELMPSYQQTSSPFVTVSVEIRGLLTIPSHYASVVFRWGARLVRLDLSRLGYVAATGRTRV